MKEPLGEAGLAIIVFPVSISTGSRGGNAWPVAS
jgi:hypothetical protein